MQAIIKELRPSQWTKNIIVLAALLFAFWDPNQSLDLTRSLITAVIAMIIFCLVSSGIYVLNDIRDITADQHHPVKKNRPVAAGIISIPKAWILSITLLAGGIIIASILSIPFARIIAGYIAIQLIYSLGLKKLALLDIIVIAVGFVLRAIAGAVVLQVDISPWLLLCTFLLALFLALCKRRHEKINLSEEGSEHRANLDKYDKRLLDQLIAITSATTLAAYAMYTLSPTTITKFGTAKLGFTIPFVIFGIFRYLDLVYRHDKGDRPEKILLTDMPILIDIILYCISVILIFMLRG